MTSEAGTAIGATPNGDTTLQADAAAVAELIIPEAPVRCGAPVDLEVLLSAAGFDGSLRLRFIATSDGSQIEEVTLPVTGRSRIPYRWISKKGDAVWTDDPDVRIESALLDTSGGVIDSIDSIRNPFDVLYIVQYTNGTKWRCVPGGNRRGERWTLNAANTYVHDPAHPYGWSANYHLQYEDGIFYVQSRILLVPQNGLVITDAMKRSWKTEIESYWNNRFGAHRRDCGRGASCSDVQAHVCCKFAVKIVCNFVSSAPLTTVNVYPGAATGPWGSDSWWYSSTWWENTSEEVPESVRAHEFGHLIGLWDEYSTGALATGVDPNTYHFNPASIMSGGGTPQLNHFTGWLYSAGVLVSDRLRAIRRERS